MSPISIYKAWFTTGTVLTLHCNGTRVRGKTVTIGALGVASRAAFNLHANSI